MRRVLVVFVLCAVLGGVAAANDRRTHEAFELKRVIEAIPAGTAKSAVVDMLQKQALAYGNVYRSDFRSDSATWMVEPIPDAAVSALTGSGGGRLGMDDDFVVFVVMLDNDEKVLVSKATVLGYF